MVSNGWFGNVGDRQVLATADAPRPSSATESVVLEVRTVPSGAPITVDGSIDVVVGASYALAAPVTRRINGRDWEFDAWTDGGAAGHQWTAGRGRSVMVATYACPFDDDDPACLGAGGN